MTLFFWRSGLNFQARPPTIYRHHKGLRVKKGISKGVAHELSDSKRTTKCIPPPALPWRWSSWLLWVWCAECEDWICKRDWSFQARLTISSEIALFSRFGPLGSTFNSQFACFPSVSQCLSLFSFCFILLGGLFFVLCKNLRAWAILCQRGEITFKTKDSLG